MQFAEIIRHWTGWCPRKMEMKRPSRTYFPSQEVSMKTQDGIRSRTKGIAALVIVVAAAFVGMYMEFSSMQSMDWLLKDPKAVEGYQWLANNTGKNTVVLAWWDYADGIEMIGERGVVIKEASKEIKNTIAGYVDATKPWHKIEYALWYPYESDEKVKDVADFFVSENATSARQIAAKYGATYSLVMSDDLGKYYPVLMAAGEHFSDYVRIPKDRPSGRFDIKSNLKKDTIYTKMVNGESIDGFSKEFDNGQMRIYRIA
ncbi:MAG: hypothetical protein A4E49_01240 [Methanosaeta sp. PtaU1.Bin112]|nr:MAG: hypothetical protein A4E49_01240 [Methanosaeta sp. PtaU1.Bin112]